MKKDGMRLPPMITKDLKSQVYALEDSFTKLECEASGNDIRYSWYMNGSLITPPGANGNIELSQPNILTLNKISFNDQAHYQCIAFNNYGSVYSNITSLKVAYLWMNASRELKTITVNENDSVKLPRISKVWSVPPAVYKWHSFEYGSKNPRKVNVELIPRVAIGDDGSLYFSHVLKSDELAKGMVYRCEVTNSWRAGSYGIQYIRLIVNAASAQARVGIKPSLMFASGMYNHGRRVTTLVGEEVTLKCFYAAYPPCNYLWNYTNAARQTNKLGSNSMTHQIKNVTESHNGYYGCSCTSYDFSKYTIRLIVQSKPVMRSSDDIPRSLNVTEGDTAVFNCRPHAIPAPSILWNINGRNVSEKEITGRWWMNSDKTQLILRHTRTDTEADDPKDTMYIPIVNHTDHVVVRCDVENVWARYSYSAYLNILARTRITSPPKDVTVKYKQFEVTFRCAVYTDASTNLHLRWFYVHKNSQNVSVQEDIDMIKGKFKLDNANETLVIRVDNMTDWPQYLGTYKCKANNTFSWAEASAVLSIAPASPDDNIVDEKMFRFIYIYVILILLFLLFLLLLSCYFRLTANQGYYKVDSYERQNGNDPLKELKENEFRNYQRPYSIYTILDCDNSSLIATSAPLYGKDDVVDECESLNEYADVDVGKFTEDGSFIGIY